MNWEETKMSTVNTKEFMEAAAQTNSMEELVEVFRSNGVDATAEDIAKAVTEVMETYGDELSEEELTDVAGGYQFGDFTRNAYNSFKKWVNQKINDAINDVLRRFGL